MCGRYVSPDSASIERHWRLVRNSGAPFSTRYNVAPTAQIPVLISGELRTARWGLIPYWWKQDQPPRLSHNARFEEAATKPMWRDAMRGARCLIPVAGWYEWRQPDKQPYYFHRNDGQLLALAGLYSIRKDGVSCAVLSTAATDRLEAVHERMPLFLDEEGERAWLEKGEIVTRAGNIAFHPVAKAVNKADNDAPGLIEPLAA